MTEFSQNGWPVLNTVEKCKQWVIPDTNIRIPLRKGPAGFVLIHVALWLHEAIELLTTSVGDDFGWSHRKIAGTNVWSNHASGTAVDLNASLHPQNTRTYTSDQVERIRDRLAHDHYGGVIRWGGDFSWGHVDEMHFEIQGHAAVIEAIPALRATSRGQRIVEANFN